MAKKEEFVGIRISKEFKNFLVKKAKKSGISLSRLIDESLLDNFKEDKEFILNNINKRKQERPVYWKELDKSPIIREFENFIAILYTEFLNPISKTGTDYQPVILIGWIHHILNATIKHCDSIPEEHKRQVASHFIESLGKTLIEGLTYIKSNDKETQGEIIDMKMDLAEKACYHFTALAFAKDSYTNIKTELEKVRKELKENSKTGA